MAEIRVRGLSKRYGSTEVLSGLDVDVPDGTTLAVVGPSGCGKTTLLRLIAGFESPDAGSIAIGGEVVSGDRWVPAHRRSVGYLPQDGGLFPHLTVAQNIAFGLPRTPDRSARVADLLEMVLLGADLGARRPDQLSGGQQQRVALARALAVRPRVMLLDEPFSALDGALRVVTRRAVRGLLDELEITTILVTHDLEEAAEFADDVGVLERGRLYGSRAGEPAAPEPAAPEPAAPEPGVPEPIVPKLSPTELSPTDPEPVMPQHPGMPPVRP